MPWLINDFEHLAHAGRTAANVPSIFGAGQAYALSAPFWEWLIGVPVLGSFVDAALLVRRARLEGRSVSSNEITNQLIFLAVGIFWGHSAIFAEFGGFVFVTILWILCSAVMFSQAHPKRSDAEYSQLFLQGGIFHTILFFPAIFPGSLPSAFVHLVQIPASVLWGVPNEFFWGIFVSGIAASVIAHLAVVIAKLSRLLPDRWALPSALDSVSGPAARIFAAECQGSPWRRSRGVIHSASINVSSRCVPRSGTSEIAARRAGGGDLRRRVAPKAV